MPLITKYIQLRIGFELRKKGENVKAEEFVKKIKNIYEKAKVTLKKLHKEIKKYIDKNKKKAVEYKIENRMLLSTTNLV